MKIDMIDEQVLELKQKHAGTWRNRPQGYWFRRLMEEAGQLGMALIGRDKTAVTLQLQRIASICLNWLEMREGE